MRIARRLFLVPLADNNHGKTTIVKALVAQGTGMTFGTIRKSARSLMSPWGRPIDAYVFGRSYQETEKKKHRSVDRALKAADPNWRTRELIIMPSHVTYIQNSNQPDDIDQIIELGRSAGFDLICATVLLADTTGYVDRTHLSEIWLKTWDERWTIPNPHSKDPSGQLEALGRDLWTWTCRTLAP